MRCVAIFLEAKPLDEFVQYTKTQRIPDERISAKVIFLGAGQQVLVRWLGVFLARRSPSNTNGAMPSVFAPGTGSTFTWQAAWGRQPPQ